MLGKEHLRFGIITGMGLAAALAPELDLTPSGMLTFGVLSAVGSILPDIDTPKSMMGKTFSHTSGILDALVGHRTFTHDIVLMNLIGIVLIFVNPIFIGLVFGYMGHLFLDALTVKGLPCAYPINKKNIHLLPKKLRFHADSTPAKLFTYLLAVGIFIACTIALYLQRGGNIF